jgi:hypothetical protein
MFSRFSITTLLVIFYLALRPAESVAQYASPGDPKPLSRVGGAAGEALNQIVRENVGQGYSAQSLNLLALQNARGAVPYVGQQTTRGSSSGSRPAFNFGGGGTNAKPFSGFSPDATVSPYLNLFREDFEGGSDLNYNTLVRPQLQQQAVNQQVQRQAIELQRQLQSVAAQADFNPQGAKDVYPTGHQTAYRYFGHYYPTMGRQRAKR